MVLPEKLFGIGLTLRSLLSPADVASNNCLQTRGLDDHAGFSTTDLVRFSGTLKVARDIVEEHKRSDIVEVPTSGLVSILDRIKALEDEVQALIDGKKVNKGSKAIESSPAVGSASGSAASPPSDASSEATSSSGPSSSSPASEDSPSGTSPSGSSSAESSPAGQSSDAGSSGGSSSSSGSDGQDDCAPEHLLYNLGGGSLQRRSMTVSEHPLFRRSTNCTLASVAGGKKVKGLPSGAAVFKDGDDASATTGSTDDTESSTPSPTADGAVADESSAANSAADTVAVPESQPAASASTATSGSASPEDAATTVPSAGATAALGSKVNASPSGSDDDDLTTITTTMTSTIYTTRTIHLRPSSTKADSPAKFVNGTQSLNSTAPAVKNGTAIAIEPETPASPIALPKQSASPLKNATASGPQANVAEPLTSKPLFEKNATLPTTSVETLAAPISQLGAETDSMTSTDTGTSITTTATTIPLLQKNATDPTSTTEITTAPTSTLEIAMATSAADAATAVLSQPLLGKNITGPTLDAETASAITSLTPPTKNDTSIAMPTDDLSTLALQSASSLVTPHSSAAAQGRFSDSGSSVTTVHLSSVTALTLTFNDDPTSTASSSSSSMTSSDPPSDMTSSSSSSSSMTSQTESTTSAMSRAAFINGTIDDRQSGFKTVTIPMSMTSVAGVQ